MITHTQRRTQILRRINRISEDKLKELDDFVSKLENDTTNKTKVLSYAGAWKELDNTIFDDFTKNLITKRQGNRNRINE